MLEIFVIQKEIYYSTPMFDIKQVTIFSTLSPQEEKEVSRYILTRYVQEKRGHLL